jgi:hypothetical protein
MTYPIKREKLAYLADIKPFKLEGTYEQTKIRRHRQPTRGCPPALGLTERITTPHAKKLICYKILHKASNLGQVLWKELSPGMPATIRSRTFRPPACYLSTQKLKYDLYGKGCSKTGC